MTLSKKSFVLISMIATLLALSSFVSAITGNIGNGKMVLYPEVNGKDFTVIEKTILVKNENNFTINVSLKTGNNFLEILDKELTIEQGDEINARFLVKVKYVETYDGAINVFFKVAEGKGAGVALTSEIVVIPKKSADYVEKSNGITGNIIGGESKGLILLVISTIVLLVVLAILVAYLKRRKNKRRVK